QVNVQDTSVDEVLTHRKEQYAEPGVIMMTGFGNITHAVRALQKGAFDYITKPFKAKEIVFRINRYFESGVTFDNRQKIEAFTENQQQNHSAKQEKLSEQTIQQGEKKFIGNNPEINK